MPRYDCKCGAHYKLPEGSQGKRARCKKCGATFVVPGEKPAPPLPPEDDVYSVLEQAAAQSHQAAAAGPSALEAAVAVGDEGGPRRTPRSVAEMPAARGAAGTLPGFLADAAWAFLFITKPSNLVIALLVWFLIVFKSLVGLAGCLGVIGSLIILGWYFAFLLNVAITAAAGEDDLPSLSMTEGIVDDIIIPIVKYVGTTLVLLVPAIVYIALNAGDTVNLLQAMAMQGVTALTDDPAAAAPLIALLLLALFLWPISILAVSLQGLGAVVRVDLAFITIARTFVPYVLTCALVGVATYGQSWLPEQLFGRINFAGGNTPWGQLILTFVVSAGLVVYLDIVAMRVVGLYYRHYKSRFAWTWE